MALTTLDKSSRFTNWSQRPLSNQQLTYAIADVTHLRTVYEELRDMLVENERSEWLDEELATLLDPKTYDNDPENAWKRIKTKNTHGTGCTLSSEITTFYACGKTLNKSCELAIKYVNQSIRSNLNYGKGHGPINHLSSIKINRKFK